MTCSPKIFFENFDAKKFIQTQLFVLKNGFWAENYKFCHSRYFRRKIVGYKKDLPLMERKGGGATPVVPKGQAYGNI